MRDGFCIEVGEKEARERLAQLNRCFTLMIPEGRGLAGGWKILSDKLQQLGVSPKKEPRREEVQGKN